MNIFQTDLANFYKKIYLVNLSRQDKKIIIWISSNTGFRYLWFSTKRYLKKKKRLSIFFRFSVNLPVLVLNVIKSAYFFVNLNGHKLTGVLGRLI